MEIIAATAARQHGVVTRLQCLAAGLTWHALQHRLETGSLIRVLPRVYRVAGAPRTWRQALMAALLWTGPGAVVSHRAAAALWPRKQQRVWRNGKLFAQFDCAYVRARIGIEADSYKWHGTRRDWDGDRARDRILRLMGWKVLRFSWEEIYFHPEYVVAEVRAALKERDVYPV